MQQETNHKKLKLKYLADRFQVSQVPNEPERGRKHFSLNNWKATAQLFLVEARAALNPYLENTSVSTVFSFIFNLHFVQD